jgi:hypothetical protein
VSRIIRFPGQMFSPDSRAFYIVSAILFLLPWSLLFFSWLAFNRAQAAVPLPSWRRCLVSAALLAASVSTALNMVWNASWLRQRGSPHGRGAGPGLWQHLGPLLLWSFAAATVLSFFGKGKARVLMFGWSLSMWVVFQLIFMLPFD